MNNLKLRKGMKVNWIGASLSKAHSYSFPAQTVEILSVDNKRELVKIGCYIHFKPESGFKHPQYRERWACFTEIERVKS
jgi:hypothetical protein